MIIKVTGDTHGERERLLDYIDQHKRDDNFDMLLICGDFGFIWNGDRFEKDFLDKVSKESNFPILFVDGNHENFDLIYRYPVIEWNGGKIHEIRPNIYHLMRGEIYTINDKKLFVFGGGYSIDKERRLLYKEYYGQEVWWEQEFPTKEECNNAIENLTKNDWKVDYIFTHSAPINVLPMISEFFISGAKANTDIINTLLEEIRQKTTYEHWYFGHYHGNKNFDNFSLLYETSINLEI